MVALHEEGDYVIAGRETLDSGSGDGLEVLVADTGHLREVLRQPVLVLHPLLSGRVQLLESEAGREGGREGEAEGRGGGGRKGEREEGRVIILRLMSSTK